MISTVRAANAQAEAAQGAPKLLVGSTMKPGAKQEVDDDDVSEEMMDMAYTRYDDCVNYFLLHYL